MSPKCEAVSDYWRAYYVSKDGLGLCTLCGNAGVLDTTATAQSPNGRYRPGRVNFCICPNGQFMRNESQPKHDALHPTET